MLTRIFSTIAVLAAFVTLANAAAAAPKCDVCINVLGKIREMVDYKALASISNPRAKADKIVPSIEKFCSKKPMNRKDNALCYNILPMKGDVAMEMGMEAKPVPSICKKLSKKNPDFCSIRYPVKTDKTTDYSKMRIKQLKQVLSDRGVTCDGCLEKSDYVKRAKETEHIEL